MNTDLRFKPGSTGTDRNAAGTAIGRGGRRSFAKGGAA